MSVRPVSRRDAAAAAAVARVDVDSPHTYLPHNYRPDQKGAGADLVH
jgi:hypothetical protein